MTEQSVISCMGRWHAAHKGWGLGLQHRPSTLWHPLHGAAHRGAGAQQRLDQRGCGRPRQRRCLCRSLGSTINRAFMYHRETRGMSPHMVLDANRSCILVSLGKRPQS